MRYREMRSYTPETRVVISQRSSSRGESNNNGGNCNCNRDRLAIISPKQGEIVSEPIVFRGTATPGEIVTILINGCETASACTDKRGCWTVNNMCQLEAGEHVVAVCDCRCRCTCSTFILESSVVPPPEINHPMDGEILPYGVVTFTGSGVPGNIIRLCIDQEPDCPGTIVLQDGSFSLTRLDLAVGSHSVTATQYDSLGNASSAVTVYFTVVGGIVPVPLLTYPVNGQIVATATPTFMGRGVPGNTIRLTRDNGIAYMDVMVDINGEFAAQFAEPLYNGQHNITVLQIDPSGEGSALVYVTFTVMA